MIDPLQSFLDHLTVERGLSLNTVFAYRSDIKQLIENLTDLGMPTSSPNYWKSIARNFGVGRFSPHGFGHSFITCYASLDAHDWYVQSRSDISNRCENIIEFTLPSTSKFNCRQRSGP